jgi:hypothetical protein
VPRRRGHRLLFGDGRRRDERHVALQAGLGLRELRPRRPDASRRLRGRERPRGPPRRRVPAARGTGRLRRRRSDVRRPGDPSHRLPLGARAASAPARDLHARLRPEPSRRGLPRALPRRPRRCAPLLRPEDARLRFGRGRPDRPRVADLVADPDRAERGVRIALAPRPLSRGGRGGVRGGNRFRVPRWPARRACREGPSRGGDAPPSGARPDWGPES